MPAPSKALLLAVVLLLSAAALAVFFRDRLISGWISAQCGLPVRLSGVDLSPRRLEFQKASVGPAEQPWLRTSGGSVRRKGDGARIVFTDGVLAPSAVARFLRNVPAPEDSVSSPAMIEKAELQLYRRDGADMLRVVSLSAESFQALGAFRRKDRALEAAHVMLRVSPERLGRVPDVWLRRFSVDRRGRRLIKCAFRGHQWTLFGRSGPLLRASWEMA